MSRVGIFSGIFDPVHDGHIAFALAAAEQAKLQEVYFLIEAKPWRKVGVTHLAHRIAMVKLAIAGSSQLKILELPDKQFSVAKTLPRLKQHFPKDDLFLLIGSDVLEHLPDWPLIDTLLKSMKLIVGARQPNSVSSGSKPLSSRAIPLSSRPKRRDPVDLKRDLSIRLQRTQDDILFIQSPRPDLSSRNIRQDLLHGKNTKGLNPKVASYIRTNWLYVSPSNSSSAS